MPTEKRGNERVAGKRLANKVIWNLEDILAIVKELWGIDVDFYGPWRRAVDLAERHHDVVMLRELALMSQELSRLSRGLARIERKARDARQGEYVENE